MAEILSPGVFIEEVPSQAQVVQPVSTSTMGVAGGAERGPTDTATLVTSYEQYTRIFGDLIRDSRMPLGMAAYFANGGRRAYVVRVAPADAVSATATVRSEQETGIFTGDGATDALTSAAGTALSFPVAPSSINLKWRAAGTPVVSENLRNRANDADVQGDAAQLAFEARVNPASIVANTGLPYLPVIDPAAATFTIDAGGPFTITLTAAVGARYATGTNGAGSTATLDLFTGFLSMEWDAAEVPTAAPITISYTPTVEETGTDDGAGVLTGDLTLGTVDYADGTWGFTATTAPIANYPVYATYSADAWDLLPISDGSWANEMQLEIQGNPDFYDIATDTYSKHNVLVRLLNDASGAFDIVETFEEIDFADNTSAQYFPDVLNDLSDLIRVTEPANLAQAPSQLNGTAFTDVIAGGDETTPNRAITATVQSGITPRTVVITWTDTSGADQTITDDGAGNLIGAVDASGTNTVNYTTGAVEFTTDADIGGNTLVTVAGRAAPAGTSVVTQFGDATAGYTAGADGTYDATNYGRDQFTSPTLQSLYQGLYALDRVEELLQVCVPDFAGDVQITTDILDYVDQRALAPAGGDRFAILSVPQASSAQEAVDYFRFDLRKFSRFAALYWPWVKVADPLRDNRPTVFPPMMHIAGIYARVDQTRNVGKSPGGTIDGALKYITGLEVETTQGERDTVYPNKINPLISSAQTGTAVWGVRTIAQESEWRYINARRLFMFAERSVYNSTFWIVFENNGPALWARIKAQIEGFLLNLFNEGMMAGTTPSQAFFVTVDETNNSEASINAGQVIIDVGIAPNKPAEFVRFRFQQKTLNS